MTREITHAVTLRRGLSSEHDDIIAVGNQKQCLKLIQALTSMAVVGEEVVDKENVLVCHSDISLQPFESVGKKAIELAKAIELVRQPTLKFDSEKDERPTKAKTKKQKT